jgi:hypothetical protein
VADAGRLGLTAAAQCVGATTLMSLLKNYCRSEGVKTGITVGIIGTAPDPSLLRR